MEADIHGKVRGFSNHFSAESLFRVAMACTVNSASVGASHDVAHLETPKSRVPFKIGI